MNFGMPTLIEASNPEESVRLCDELGLDFVELNMNFPELQNGEWDAERLGELKDRYKKYFTFHMDERLDVCDFNPLISEAYRQTAVQTVELAKKLGSPVINMHLSKGIYITLPDRREFLYKTYRDRYLSALEQFRSEMTAASEGQVLICVENTDGWDEHEKEGVELLLESKSFALTWDVGHDKCADKGDGEWIKQQGRLSHIHLHDADKSCHLALGDGKLDIPAILDTAMQNQCRCVLETKTVEALSRSVKYIKDMWGGFEPPVRKTSRRSRHVIYLGK